MSAPRFIGLRIGRRFLADISVQPHPKRMSHFQDCGKARVAFAGEGLVQPFASQAGSRQLVRDCSGSTRAAWGWTAWCQLLTVIVSADQPFERQLHSETGLTTYAYKSDIRVLLSLYAVLRTIGGILLDKIAVGFKLCRSHFEILIAQPLLILRTIGVLVKLFVSCGSG